MSLLQLENPNISLGALHIALFVGLAVALWLAIVLVKHRKNSSSDMQHLDAMGVEQSPPNFEINVELMANASSDSDDDNDPFTKSGRPKLFQGDLDTMVAPCRDCSHSKCLCGELNSPMHLFKARSGARNVLTVRPSGPQRAVTFELGEAASEALRSMEDSEEEEDGVVPEQPDAEEASQDESDRAQ